MKRKIAPRTFGSFVFCSCLLLAGCGAKESGRAELPVVDMLRDYPEVSFDLEQVAEVRYLTLESKEGYWVASAPAYVDDEHIVYANRKTGTVCFFDSAGRAVKRIDRQGRGGQEYNLLSGFAFDAVSDEAYVYDAGTSRIQVYGRDGTFLRSLVLPEGISLRSIHSLNADWLLCYQSSPTDRPYVLVSKSDGRMERLEVGFRRRLSLSFVRVLEDGTRRLFRMPEYPVIGCKDGFLLSELSCDTVFRLGSDLRLEPVFTRTPPVLGMPSPVMWQVAGETDRYLFFNTVGEFKDREVLLPEMERRVLDKRTGRFYAGGELIDRATGYRGVPFEGTDLRDGIDWVLAVDAVRLCELRDEGKIGPEGSLHGIVEHLEEEDNPVLCIVRFRE